MSDTAFNVYSCCCSAALLNCMHHSQCLSSSRGLDTAAPAAGLLAVDLSKGRDDSSMLLLLLVQNSYLYAFEQQQNW